MSLIDPADVEARQHTGLDPDTLQTVIDQQEAWLARRIGQLVGERSVTYTPGPGPLFLSRPTDAVAIANAGGTLDPSQYVLSGETRIDSTVGWGGPVTITYTPIDEQEVRQAAFQLVQLAVFDSPFLTESGESRSATRFTTYNRQRAMIARTLQVNRGPMAVPQG